MRTILNDNFPESSGMRSGMAQLPCLLRLIGYIVFALLVTVLVFSRAEAAPEKIVLTAADGYRITGILTKGDSREGVVLLHMYGRSKESWQPLIEQLQARGITSLAIDMRGHGESRLDPAGKDDLKRVVARDPDLFIRMHLDAEAAVRYLVEHGIKPGKVGLVGASVGCSVAIQTVAEGKVPVAAVVVMTPGKDYLGIPTMRHIKNWPGTPLLILTSREEQNRGAAAIYDRLKNDGATLRIFEQEDIHGTNMFGEVDDVEKLIADRLAAALDGLEGKSISQLPVYRIKLRVHLAGSGRMPDEFKPIFAEINEIWRSQAGICFEIQTVNDDATLADGLDMWFSPDIGGFNGYYDGENIQMTDAPVLSKAPHPARSSAARTAAHELGHALGLPHRQDSDDNLMRSKTYGWQLNDHEIRMARQTATDLAIKDTTQRDCGPPVSGSETQPVAQPSALP